MHFDKKQKKFITVYNCMEDRVSPEIINTDCITHVYLSMPERSTVVIEYVNPAVNHKRAMQEYYVSSIVAERRILELRNLLCCNNDIISPINRIAYEFGERENEI